MPDNELYLIIQNNFIIFFIPNFCLFFKKTENPAKSFHASLKKKGLKKLKDCTKSHVKMSIIIPFNLKTLIFS